MELEELQRNWDEFGKRDPLWAILTDPEKRGGKWDVEEFFRSGQGHVNDLVDRLSELGLPTTGAVLDFGCGVGRLSQAFGEHFDECWGLDIAPSMIEGAELFNHHGARVRYVVNTAPDLARFEDGTFDLVFSVIVLQHMRPEVARKYIREFFRVIRAGGAVVFQIPSHLPREPLPDGAYVADLTADPPESVAAHRFFELAVQVTNAGDSTWPQRPDLLRLGNHWLDHSGTEMQRDSGREPIGHQLAPGESADLVLRIPAPKARGRYTLELDIVHEGVTWFAQRGSRTLRASIEVVAQANRPRGFLTRLGRRDAARPEDEDTGVVALDEPVMEMHTLPKRDVLDLIAQVGGALVAVEKNDYALPWESYTYFATKPAADSRNEA